MQNGVDCQTGKWDEVAGEVRFSAPIDLESLAQTVPPQSRILDYGCGYGRVCRALEDVGLVNVVGYDTSREMIKRGQAENGDLDLRHVSTHVLPEESASFRVAIVAAVLTCLPSRGDRKAVLSEIRRLVEPKGLLILSEFSREDRRTYDRSGCFTSSVGVRMKHFLPGELESELSGWDIQDLRFSDAESLGGGPARVIQIRCQLPGGRDASTAG